LPQLNLSQLFHVKIGHGSYMFPSRYISKQGSL
jgi:hypothetical protein